MKKYFILIPLLFTIEVFSQSNSDVELALQSLEFLNQKLHLNLKKENTTILISINGLKYIYNDYLDSNSYVSISRIKYEYELSEADSNSKYNFKIICSSEFRGTFKTTNDNGNLGFSNLEYISTND